MFASFTTILHLSLKFLYITHTLLQAAVSCSLSACGKPLSSLPPMPLCSAHSYQQDTHEAQAEISSKPNLAEEFSCLGTKSTATTRLKDVCERERDLGGDEVVS